ncbi:hypothetical protein AMR72_11040 [Flavobacterium psychrophilum]|nr:hypothetical protein AMR72_11040 [Flavobacterium psychrophilum]AOE53001.1 hypothetical protein ALW18_11030 [Flavobacterium psychrophilum]
MELKSKNPFLSNKSFTKGTPQVYDAQGNALIDFNNTMTVSGAMNKSFILLLLLLTGAFTVWYMIMNGSNPFPFMITGAVVGLIMVIASAFKPQYSQYLAPAYALFEGLFIGGLSVVIDSMYPGVALQAVGATFVTFGVCLALYKFKVVKVTEQFRSVVIAATIAIATYYIISLLASWLFNFQMVGRGFNDSSWMSIGISVFVIVIAALNLFLDFDLIEKGAEQRQPKYMEWFGAMGLMVTLVWLYVEFLRLFAKLSSRD